MCQDLRGGGSFKLSFVHRSFLRLIVKKNYENWSILAEIITKNGPLIKIVYVEAVHCQLAVLSCLLVCFGNNLMGKYN